MIEAFKEGDDIHAATAAKVYKISIDKLPANETVKQKQLISVSSTASAYSDWQNV